MKILRFITWRRLRMAGIIAASLLVLFTLVGFFVLPPLAKSLLTQRFSEALRRPVSIEEIRVNPYTLTVTVRGFKVGEREGAQTFVAFEELYVNAELSSIIRRGPVLKEIRLTRPTVRLVRHAEAKYNFSDLLVQSRPAPSSPPPQPSEPLRFSLNNIAVIEGSADFVDEPVGKTHTVRGLNIGIPFVSNIPSLVQIFTEPKIEARINDDTYVVRGKTKPFADSLESTFDIDIGGLDIPKYLAYSPVPLKFRVPSGALDIKAAVTFLRQKQSQHLTVQGAIVLKDFALTDRRDAGILTLPVVEVGIAPSEPLARKIHVAAVKIQTPEVTVRREKDGLTNIQAILPDAPKASPDKTAPAPAKSESIPAEPAAPLTFLVDAIELTGGKVAFSDAVPAKPFRTTLHPIDLTVTNLGNAPEARATVALSLRTEAKEEITAEGELTLTPLSAAIKTTTKSIPLTKYAPFYQDLVRFTLKSGKVDTAATLVYADGKDAPEIRVADVAVTLRDLAIVQEDGSGEYLRVPILAVKDAQIDLNKRAVSVGSLTSQKGALQVTRDDRGEMVLFRLLVAPPAEAPAPAPPPAGPAPAVEPWTVVLRRANFDEYAITFDDRFTSPPTVMPLENVQLTLQNLSTAKGQTGKVSLNFRLFQAAQVGLATALSLDPLLAQGSLEIKRLPISRYAPYYRKLVGFEVEDGVTDVATNFSYTKTGQEPDLKLAGLGVVLDNLRLRLRQEKEALLSVPAFAIRNGTLDLARREVSLGEISSQKGTLRVVRSETGKLNVEGLVPPAPAAQEPATAAPAATQAAPAAPWVAAVGSLTLGEYRIDVTDRVPAEPVSMVIDGIGLQVKDFTTKPKTQSKVDLALRINQTGTLQVGGTVGLSPLAAALDVSLKTLDIRPLQPYFTDKVKIAVSEGSVSAAGSLALTEREGAGLGATYKGEISVNRFASIDKANAEDFLGWQSLAVNAMDVGHNPFHFRARQVALTDYFARLVLHENGALNLQDILVKNEGAPPAAATPDPAAAPPRTPPASQPPAEIRIDEVTLQGGRISFTDRSVKPGYSTTMVEMGGRVSGLSSALNTVADLNLQGKLENSAPLEITGKINPLTTDLFVDLKVRFRDIELSKATPYSGKYIGYTIQKGKLNLDLTYLIDKRKLDSQNIISLDQFTLGDPVESPHATKLPVKLAISLLKDRNGEINLDIPVTGSLDDPQFSIWRIVFQIIGNLIVKAVTSPFALLGSAFGGGEQMNYVEFESGSAAITAEGQKKLDALAKALLNRPSLKLDIESFVDVEQDREILRNLFFARKLQAQKVLDQTKRGLPRVPVDAVTVESQEYEKYLKMAYDAEPFPKPRNVIGMVKSLPADEMEKLIRTHIQVTDDDLRALASQRANAVKDALTRAQVPPERIFILTPKALAPEKKEKQKDSRVEFKIG